MSSPFSSPYTPANLDTPQLLPLMSPPPLTPVSPSKVAFSPSAMVLSDFLHSHKRRCTSPTDPLLSKVLADPSCSKLGESATSDLPNVEQLGLKKQVKKNGKMVPELLSLTHFNELKFIDDDDDYCKTPDDVPKRSRRASDEIIRTLNQAAAREKKSPIDILRKNQRRGSIDGPGLHPADKVIHSSSLPNSPIKKIIPDLRRSNSKQEVSNAAFLL